VGTSGLTDRVGHPTIDIEDHSVPEAVRAAATLEDRAILDVGSGTLAVDAAGRVLWQRPPPPVPVGHATGSR